MYKLIDETVVERYLENPYWQHFSGEVYFNLYSHLTRAILNIFVMRRKMLISAEVISVLFSTFKMLEFCLNNPKHIKLYSD